MRLIGYDNYDWEADGYWYILPTRFVPTVNIEPLTIPRPGTTATWGMSTIGEIVFPGAFGYTGSVDIEDAFMTLLTRLNPLDQTPRQLRAQRNNGAEIVAIPAKLRVLSGSDDEDVNIYPLQFVSVEPYWTQLTASTISGTF